VRKPRSPKQVAKDKINEKVQNAKDRVNPRAYKDPDKQKTWGGRMNAVSRNAHNDSRNKKKGR